LSDRREQAKQTEFSGRNCRAELSGGNRSELSGVANIQRASLSRVKAVRLKTNQPQQGKTISELSGVANIQAAKLSGVTPIRRYTYQAAR